MFTILLGSWLGSGSSSGLAPDSKHGIPPALL